MPAAIVIFFIFVLGIIIYSISKNAKRRNEAIKINDEIEEDQDFLLEILLRVTNDKSFKIIDSSDGFQWVEMDINKIIQKQEDYSNLDRSSLKTLAKFANFLIFENEQFPIFLINNNNALVPLFNEDNKISGFEYIINLKTWKKKKY